MSPCVLLHSSILSCRVVPSRVTGNTERVFKNDVAKEVQKIEGENPGKIEAIRHLVSGENYRKSFQETGDPSTSVWSAGVVMGLINDVPTCEQLLKQMVRRKTFFACFNGSWGKKGENVGDGAGPGQHGKACCGASSQKSVCFCIWCIFEGTVRYHN